ncbi:MAG: NAD-dependent deacetylase [Thermomicrobiales bacterium]|nr:NAD-dependent deacetylase [Thermomicrobiales bacterium]
MTEQPNAEPTRATDPSTATGRSLSALIELVSKATKIVALTGAGVSTESGIPDYRGPGGVWERQAPPTIGDFLENPETRRAYWDGRRTRYPELVAAKPNAGHLALAALERSGRLSYVITQNIDGLHQAAGNSPDRVIELHGTAHRIRCLACGTEWPADVIQARLAAAEGEPRCDVCGGPLRAATILFGEALPREALDRAIAAARDCDLMLVVGSSLIVNPAAQLPVLAKRGGARLAMINRTPTPLDALADVHVIGEAGPTLAAVAAGVTGQSPEQ